MPVSLAGRERSPDYLVAIDRGDSMLDWIAGRLDISPSVVGAMLGLIIVQLALQIYAVVDLIRRDRVRGDRKWVWALVIAFGNLVGAIVYLAVGRAPAAVDIPASTSGASTAGGEAARRAVESLYGPRDRR